MMSRRTYSVSMRCLLAADTGLKKPAPDGYRVSTRLEWVSTGWCC